MKSKKNKGILKNIKIKIGSNMCICKKCPSYPCSKKCNEILYCSKGKSSKKIKKKGCICGNCLIFKMGKFTEGYYCISGIAKENK